LNSSERWRVAVESIGLVAIVLSIVFLAFEVRQNTQAMRAAAIQDTTDVARQQLLTLVGDREAHRIEMLGHENPDQLTPEERRRYFYMIRSFWLGMQGLYRQWRLGVLPEEEWQVMSVVICDELKYPGVQISWSEQGLGRLIPEFIELVESQCAVN
jgi:hypothetical protein